MPSNGGSGKKMRNVSFVLGFDPPRLRDAPLLEQEEEEALPGVSSTDRPCVGQGVSTHASAHSGQQRHTHQHQHKVGERLSNLGAAAASNLGGGGGTAAAC